MGKRKMKDYKCKDSVLSAFDWWIQHLGLRNWDINIILQDTIESPDGESIAVGVSSVLWEYLSATIMCNMSELEECSQEEIEEHIVHELCHILTSEMLEEGENKTKHVERVVVYLTRAFMWIKNSGNKSDDT